MALARVTEPELSVGERRARVAALGGALGRRVRDAGMSAASVGRWLGDLLVDTAPHIPIRDLPTLVEHHHGLTGEALADALVKGAARTTTGIGAATGTLVAAQWFTAPVLVAVPLEIVVETLAVAAVEVKLIGELHAVYEIPIPGTGTERAVALGTAWARRRGVDPIRAARAASILAAGRSTIGRSMMNRLGRNLGGLAPLLLGAWFAARSNRAQTRALGDGVRTDLRARRATTTEAPSGSRTAR